MSQVMSSTRFNRRARGTALIYSVMVLFVLFGMTSLALDWARVQSAEAELKDATDAAARAALSGLQKGQSVVESRAIEYAGQNSVANSTLVLTTANVKIGTWNTDTRVFKTRTSEAYYQLDAVQITASKSIPLLFSKLFPNVTINAVSVAALTDKPTVVPGTCNPWLAGMPEGTPGNTQDSAGDENQSPVQVMGVSLVPGSYLTFGEVTGAVANGPTIALNDPDGGDIYDHVGNAENGMADLEAPINSLIGVFLSDAQPNLTPAPAALDFTSSSSRNHSTYSPLLKQPFFIGDGLRNNGNMQRFRIPNGATRLFLGTMDGYEWNNNKGSLTLGQNLGKGGIVLVK